MSLQVFQYQNNPITFNLNGEVMVNATQMAKPFGKRPAEFLRLPSTIEYLEALESSMGKSHSELYQTVNGGTSPGTWFCQKLTLRFAQWLSVKFSVWVDTKIEELLTTGKTEIQSLSDVELLAKALQVSQRITAHAQERVLMLESRTEEQEQVIKEQAPKVDFYNKVLNAEGLLTATIAASHFGITATSFNRILKDRKIQYKVSDVWTLYSKYKGKGYTENKPYPFTGTDGKERLKDRMLWTPKGLEFLYTVFNPHSNAA